MLNELSAARIQQEEHEFHVEDLVCSKRDSEARIRTVCNMILYYRVCKYKRKGFICINRAYIPRCGNKGLVYINGV